MTETDFSMRQQSVTDISPNLKRVKKINPSASVYDYDYLFKIVILGSTGCGKTSMMVRFVDNKFDHSTLCTIGVDFKMKTLEVDGKVIKM